MSYVSMETQLKKLLVDAGLGYPIVFPNETDTARAKPYFVWQLQIGMSRRIGLVGSDPELRPGRVILSVVGEKDRSTATILGILEQGLAAYPSDLQIALTPSGTCTILGASTLGAGVTQPNGYRISATLPVEGIF